MNTSRRKEFEKLIAEEIARTEKTVADYSHMVVPEPPDCAIGRVSRMDAINNRSVAEAGLRQAQDKLSKLKFALSKIDTDEFGLCRKCNNEIPLMRLMLMPQSLFCVHCAK
jgi:DnaK suppressor protein